MPSHLYRPLLCDNSHQVDHWVLDVAIEVDFGNISCERTLEGAIRWDGFWVSAEPISEEKSQSLIGRSNNPDVKVCLAVEMPTSNPKALDPALRVVRRSCWDMVMLVR
jgi:hypothetical protein